MILESEKEAEKEDIPAEKERLQAEFNKRKSDIHCAQLASPCLTSGPRTESSSVHLNNFMLDSF